MAAAAVPRNPLRTIRRPFHRSRPGLRPPIPDHRIMERDCGPWAELSSFPPADREAKMTPVSEVILEMSNDRFFTVTISRNTNVQ